MGAGTPREAAGWILEPGEQVDHFQVVRPLGRGGMAQVFLARDTKLGRKVALKVVQPGALGDQEGIERFLFEARATARFNHPHIVTIYAVGEAGDQPYVALEYLQGQSLRQRMEQERPGVGEALRIGLGVAEALAEAHAHNIIHRDLKPENVMLGADGRLRVVDFGLARVLYEADQRELDATSLDLPTGQSSSSREAFRTEGKGLRGTPAYMAPEQWREQETSGATDVWALGVLLYELLVGQRPFRAPSVFKLALAICGDQPVPARELEELAPPAVAALVLGCLSRAPDERSPAAEVADRLRELVEGRARLGRDENPFRGLMPFHEQHAHLFFGRDAEIAAFIERLRSVPVLPVVGPSGAGKSSFVQAGVIPRLRERGPLELLQLRPGFQPFAALAERVVEAGRPATSSGATPFGTSREIKERPATERDEAAALAERLRSSPRLLGLELTRLAECRHSSVMLFVDQLEELYALVEEEALRRAFMEAISSAADDPQAPVRVVFTLREEFLARLAGGAAAREALSQITVLRSPGPEALRETLISPVAAAGYRYEDPSLVEEMVDEVGGEVSSLPLVQFTGQLLWERRDRERQLLTRTAYEAIGRIAGALASHADGVLAGFSAEETAQARAILLRMVTPDGTRRAMSRAQALEGLDGAATVLERLMDARLVAARQEEGGGAAELELAHEALLTRWERLRRWIDEGREDLVFLAEVGEAAKLWERRGHRVEEVWTGEALFDAERAARRCSTEVPLPIRRFLAASRLQQRTLTRKRRLLYAAVLVVLALFGAGGVIAAITLSRQKRAVDSSRKAAEERLAATLREAARAALDKGNTLEARARLRLSLEALDAGASRALWNKLARDPRVWSKQLAGTGTGIGISPDGKFVAVGVDDAKVHIHDLASGRLHRMIQTDQGGGSVALSPGGGLLAVAETGSVTIWDPLSGGQVGSLRAGRSGVMITSVSFSPDGTLLAAGGTDRTVRIWDHRRHKLVHELRGHRALVKAVCFSPDGRLLASAGGASLKLWEVATGRPRRTVDGAVTWWVDFSPDGGLLAVGRYDGSIELIEAAGGRPEILRGHGAKVHAVAFSPDGRWLASADHDGVIKLWGVQSRRLAASIRGHTDGVVTIKFTPDGETLVTAGYDWRVRVWRLRRLLLRRPEGGHEGRAQAVSFSPRGDLVASAGTDGQILLRDAASGVLLRRLTGRTQINNLRFSPDGTLLAAVDNNVAVKLWRRKTGALVRVLEGHTAALWGLDFSPSGRLLASGGFDRTVRIWDPRSGALLRTLVGHKSQIFGVEFSPDGRRLASFGHEPVIRLWDPSTGRAVRGLKGSLATVMGVAFSPDGGHLVATDTSGAVQQWSLVDGKSQILWRGAGSRRADTALYHPTGGKLVTNTYDGRVQVWDRATRRLKPLWSAWDLNFRIAVNVRSGLIAAGGVLGAARVWDATTARPHWRGTALLLDPPELLTHQGWTVLGASRRLAAPSGRKRKAWRENLERRALIADQAGDRVCVLTLDHHLELWTRSGDRRIFRKPAPGAQVTRALRGGCLTRTYEGQVVRYDGSGAKRVLGSRVNMINTGPDHRLLLTRKNEVTEITPEGATRSHKVAGEASAASIVGKWLITSFQDGRISLYHRKSGAERTDFRLEDVPSSLASFIRGAPQQTLVVGFGNGEVGIWDLTSGKRLEAAHLHGAVIHLRIADKTLYVATDVGDHLTWDLSALYLERCELLRRVWREVPVVWDKGKAVPRPPPKEHPCLEL